MLGTLTSLVGGRHFAHLVVGAAAEDLDERALLGAEALDGLVHLRGQVVGQRQAQRHQQPLKIAARFALDLRRQILRPIQSFPLVTRSVAPADEGLRWKGLSFAFTLPNEAL